MQGNESDRTGGSKGGNTGGNSIELADYRLSRDSTGMIHSEIRSLYNYWDGLRAGRPCPYRAEVDPRDMAGDARHLFVIEDLAQGNMRFRLAGTALLDAFGYELRGMSARSIMEGRARESFIALISETLAEPGVGYARLLAPDGATVWEVVLLPLRDNFGKIVRLIGCLHPVNGYSVESGDTPLRFTIDEMSIRQVEVTPDTVTGNAMPLAGFGEGQASFTGTPKGGLTAIDGGLNRAERLGGDERPKLRLVRDEE
jgi:hypothetical protein